MPVILSSDEVSKLTRQIAAVYASENLCQTFGEYVLDTFYPDINRYELINARDFAGADRMFDGRMYLSGMLLSGCLDAAPLLKAAAQHPPMLPECVM